MNQENHLSLAYRVAPEHGGERLDRFLAAAAANLSRTRVKSLIEAGHASIDGAMATDPSYLLRAGQTAGLRLPRSPILALRAAFGSRILSGFKAVLLAGSWRKAVTLPEAKGARARCRGVNVSDDFTGWLLVHHPSFDTSSRAVQEGPELGAKVGSHSKRFDTLCAKTRQNPQLLAPDGTIA